MATDRENNHTGSKKTPSKQGEAYFIENSWSMLEHGRPWSTVVCDHGVLSALDHGTLSTIMVTK